ncbi:MAG: hypothetical protein RMM53_05110 [Bacteroidia bacterium]|nr:hypothetical protein [Bacteroidia bacterium]MDW8333578.1 hypothetical protein [Bacteroidia bacterium]
MRAPFAMFCGLFALLTLGPVAGAEAKQILADLDFENGHWIMVGVRLYNYRPVEMQKRLGTFVLADSTVLQTLKRKWIFSPFWDDDCDYHYALKFYQGKTLRKTLKINLHCRYITDGGLSYHFDPALLEEYEKLYRRVPWTTLTFHSLDSLRRAIAVLARKEEVLFYDPPEKYLLDGYYVRALDGLAWNVNRDSLTREVRNALIGRTGIPENPEGTMPFVVEPLIFFVEDDFSLSMRWKVYCNKKHASVQGPGYVSASWREHLHPMEHGETGLQLTVIGVDERLARTLIKDG